MPHPGGLRKYLKGFVFDEVKTGKKFDFDAFAEPTRFDNIVFIVIDTVLEPEGYVAFALGKRRPLSSNPSLVSSLGYVLVLDDDDDKERLLARPLPEVHSSIIRIQEILEGPGVWELQ